MKCREIVSFVLCSLFLSVSSEAMPTRRANRRQKKQTQQQRKKEDRNKAEEKRNKKKTLLREIKRKMNGSFMDIEDDFLEECFQSSSLSVKVRGHYVMSKKMMKKRDHEKALEHGEKACELVKREQDIFKKSYLETNLAFIYLYAGYLNKAEELYYNIGKSGDEIDGKISKKGLYLIKIARTDESFYRQIISKSKEEKKRILEELRHNLQNKGAETLRKVSIIDLAGKSNPFEIGTPRLIFLQKKGVKKIDAADFNLFTTALQNEKLGNDNLKNTLYLSLEEEARITREKIDKINIFSQDNAEVIHIYSTGKKRVFYIDENTEKELTHRDIVRLHVNDYSSLYRRVSAVFSGMMREILEEKEIVDNQTKGVLCSKKHARLKQDIQLESHDDKKEEDLEKDENSEAQRVLELDFKIHEQNVELSRARKRKRKKTRSAQKEEEEDKRIREQFSRDQRLKQAFLDRIRKIFRGKEFLIKKIFKYKQNSKSASPLKDREVKTFMRILDGKQIDRRSKGGTHQKYSLGILGEGSYIHNKSHSGSKRRDCESQHKENTLRLYNALAKSGISSYECLFPSE